MGTGVKFEIYLYIPPRCSLELVIKNEEGKRRLDLELRTFESEEVEAEVYRGAIVQVIKVR